MSLGSHFHESVEFGAEMSSDVNCKSCSVMTQMSRTLGFTHLLAKGPYKRMEQFPQVPLWDSKHLLYSCHFPGEAKFSAFVVFLQKMKLSGCRLTKRQLVVMMDGLCKFCCSYLNCLIAKILVKEIFLRQFFTVFMANFLD